jgi:hypothetical protein
MGVWILIFYLIMGVSYVFGSTNVWMTEVASAYVRILCSVTSVEGCFHVHHFLLDVVFCYVLYEL